MVLRGIAAAKEDMARREKLEHSVELPLKLLYLQARANDLEVGVSVKFNHAGISVMFVFDDDARDWMVLYASTNVHANSTPAEVVAVEARLDAIETEQAEATRRQTLAEQAANKLSPEELDALLTEYRRL
jgi:hypothetical protein